MRISDWSSDVCSSDLIDDRAALALHARDRSLCAEHHAIEIDVERALPDLRRLLFKIGEMRDAGVVDARSEEHTSELESLMRISYAVLCLTKTNIHNQIATPNNIINHTAIQINKPSSHYTDKHQTRNT